jgi:hypothetical protein
MRTITYLYAMKCLPLLIAIILCVLKTSAQSIGPGGAGRYIGKTVHVDAYVKSACRFPHSKSIVLALSDNRDQPTQLTLIVSLAHSHQSDVEFFLWLPGNYMEFTGKISGYKGHLVIRLTKDTEIEEPLPSYDKNTAAKAAN